MDKAENGVEYFWVFLAFVIAVYPYFDIEVLTKDMYIVRYWVQNKLSYFNDFLNRQHIGL